MIRELKKMSVCDDQIIHLPVFTSQSYLPPIKAPSTPTMTPPVTPVSYSPDPENKEKYNRVVTVIKRGYETESDDEEVFTDQSDEKNVKDILPEEYNDEDETSDQYGTHDDNEYNSLDMNDPNKEKCSVM